MTKTILQEKYPVFSLEISKDKTDYKTVVAILEYFKSKIEADKVAKYIGTFNHYEHTQSLEDEGSIAEGIVDAQLVMFCFGKKVPNAQMLAVRPRTIAIVEYAEHFTLSFMEAPTAPATAKMQTWIENINNK